MIEQILTRRNLLQAMRKVQKNHGSAGVDHMPVTKLTELLSIDKEYLTAKGSGPLLSATVTLPQSQIPANLTPNPQMVTVSDTS